MSNPRRTLAPGLAPAGSSLLYPELEIVTPAPDGLAPPVAPVIPRSDVVHGETRIDPYHWLRDRSNPDVIAYLEAENQHTDEAMRHTVGLQEQLYQEMRARIRETDLSVPERLDDYLYYSRTETGGQYPILCRRRCGSNAPEEILLDQNQLAAGHPYFKVGTTEVSPDHHLLAYSIDTSGAEEFTLVVKDLLTGNLLPERWLKTAPLVAWANDRTLFYTVLDETRRPYRLYRHRLGTDPATDVLVYHETDSSFYLDVSRTRSRQYLFLDLSSHSTTEVRFVSADHPEEPFRVVEWRRPGIEYSVTHHEDHFFITTNDGAPNFRLVQAPTAHPGKENWSPVLPHRSDVKLDSTDAFRGHLAIYEREAGLTRIRILELATGIQHLVPFPEPVYTVRAHANPEFETTLLRFSYTSLVTPISVVEYDMAAHTWTVRKQTEVRGYHPAGYRSERLFATAPDGVRVPVSLVYRTLFQPDRARPLLLSGYGAYGLSYEPVFSSNVLSLLDRGFVVAIAHVRGGEELGRSWYEGGRLLNKRSSFTDFIAAAEHLINEGYTAPERLAINGGSAGGLLVGAVTNLRPDLFHAVLADVPFVDVVNTMLDASLPLTVIEYDEWGNPNDPEYFAYMMTYSPYDNVVAQDYPAILVTTGYHDSQVQYWEPAKWVARLRELRTNDRPLLFETNMEAGHGGASARFQRFREIATEFAFLIGLSEGLLE
jgi:oligopeptidase B